MRRAPSALTRTAGILGWPVANSLSPAIHNAAFLAAGLDWIYVAFEVPPDDLPSAVAGIRALGFGGANVTMPHKQAIMPMLDRISGDAQRCGAVNTIVNESGILIGANTDGTGFLRFLKRDAGMDVAAANVLILGSGGAARSLAVGLTGAGASVSVCARDTASAQRVASLGGPKVVVAGWEARDAAAAACDLIVNATPIGTDGAGSPLDARAFRSGAAVVDLVYSPPLTPLMVAARAAGATAHNGLGMLLHQAVLAFELWTGTPAPEVAMSAALVAAVGRHGGVPGV